MKRFLILFSLIMLMAGCGYHVVDVPRLRVFINPVNNQTDRSTLGMTVERAIEKQMIDHGFSVVTTPEASDVQIRITLHSGETRTIQSGSDNRVTASREDVIVEASLVKESGPVKRSRRFSLLTRYPTDSHYYYNDSGREEGELADQIGLQVMAWLAAR